MRLRPISVLALVVLLTSASPTNKLSAQTTTSGGLTGVVTDPSRAVVPDAEVEIRDNAKSTAQSTKTDREGVYRFFFLARGRYTLTVGHEGFQKELPGPPGTVNLTFEIAQANRTGGALLLETDTSFSGIGLTIPQNAPSSATLNGPYAMLLSDQNAPPNSDGGFTGSLAAPSSSGPNPFSGEGDFQTQNVTTPVPGPLSGTFIPDASNPGHFAGTITATPAFPNDTPVGSGGPTTGCRKSLSVSPAVLEASLWRLTLLPRSLALSSYRIRLQLEGPSGGARSLVRQQQAQSIKRVIGLQVRPAKQR